MPEFKTPSLALKIGYVLKKVAVLQRGVALRTKDKGYLDELWYFIELVETEWSHRISKVALNTLAENSFSRVEVLPLTEDLVALKLYMEKEMKILCARLEEVPTLDTWRKLA